MKRRRNHQENNNIKKYQYAPEVEDLQSLIELSICEKQYINIDNKMLKNILSSLIRLNYMVGIEELKKTIFHQILYYIQNLNKRDLENEYLHTVILGAPGTGKTTVAEIIGELYSRMGILSDKKIFKITKREDFIAEYLGQTAIKTKKLLKSCLGGVIFIDEVYALGPGQSDKDSFSKEAIDTINVFLSEHKNDICCIIAGYEKNINNCFFSVNPGLKRRFPWVHRINNYTEKDLAKIMLKMVNDINWEINVSLDELEKIFFNNKNLFINAGGDIEVYLTKCKIVHSKRVFSLESRHKFILTKEDILEAISLFKKNNLTDQNLPPTSMYI